MAKGFVVKTADRDEVIPLVSIYEYQTVTIGSGFSKHRIGDKCRMSDGRVYHWALNGTDILAAGNVVQNSVTPVGHRNMTPTVLAALKDTRVQVVPVTTAIVKNEYSNGYLWVNVSTGAGIPYKIKSNPAIGIAAAGYIELYDPIIVATAAGSRISLARNPWYGTLLANSTVDGLPVGVAPIAVPASTATTEYYYWAQTWGPGVALAGGTLVITTPCLTAGTGEGTVIVCAAHGIPEVGMLLGGLQVTDAEYDGIFIRISQ
jgi:hypothetical protein